MNVRKLKVNLDAIKASEGDDGLLNHDGVRLGSLLVSSHGLTSPTMSTSYDLGLDDFVLSSEREGPVLLGKGSSGFVRKAMNRRTGKCVALKEIQVTSKTRQNEIRRELETFYMSGAPGSSYMVDFYGAFYYEGSVFIAMECMDGSLDHLPHPIPTGVLACIIRSVLHGLIYLHRQRHLIHRDLKPGNLLFSRRTGDVKISDFGISSPLDGTGDNAQTFVGTVMYMSPERLKGEQYSYAADVWSFGLVVAEMALGRQPFGHLRGETSETRFWALLQHLSADKPVLELPDTMEPPLADFISLCLRKDPAARPSCVDLLQHPFLMHSESSEFDRASIQKWVAAVVPATPASKVLSVKSERSKHQHSSSSSAEELVQAAPPPQRRRSGKGDEDTATSSTLNLDDELQRLVEFAM